MGSRKKRYNLYLEVELIERLEEEAKEKNISTSEYIRNILNQDLNEEILSGANIEIRIKGIVHKDIKKMLQRLKSETDKALKAEDQRVKKLSKE